MKRKVNKNSPILKGVFPKKQPTQTDFGNIYFSRPSLIVSPKTTRELARTLKSFNHKGVGLTIRNTGHSVNGQTLTNGVQINIGNIKKINFDKENMTVTAGAGNTWDEVLQAVNLPKYCPPVFPTNPNQEIKIGGTAAVGGVGPYSSHNGGFWNHVESLKLVTMKGEIINCSREENKEYFSYALAGFGRIGVISELMVRVVPSKKNVLILALVYRKERNEFEKDLAHLAQDGALNGIFLSEILAEKKILSSIGLTFPIVVIMSEVDDEKNVQEKIDYIKNYYHGTFDFFLQETDKASHLLDGTLRANLVSKPGLVYWYPHGRHDQAGLSFPWSDYVVPKDSYMDFVEETKKIIYRNNMQNFFVKEAFLRGHMDTHHMPSYIIKRLSPQANQQYPLALDLKNDDDYSFGIDLPLSVPQEKIQTSIDMIREITNLCYDLKGKRYLYGIHDLTKSQVEQHFGRDVIGKWQSIKDELDPKHLLNIGVIEHLDS